MRADVILQEGTDFTNHPIPVTASLARDPEGQEAVDMGHARWITDLEETLLDVEQDPHKSCKARRNGFKVSWRTSKATPGRVHVEDKPSGLWSVAATMISRFRKLVAKGLDLGQQHDLLKRIRSVGLAILDGTDQQLFGKRADQDKPKWDQMLHQLCGISK